MAWQFSNKGQEENRTSALSAVLLPLEAVTVTELGNLPTNHVTSGSNC